MPKEFEATCNEGLWGNWLKRRQGSQTPAQPVRDDPYGIWDAPTSPDNFSAWAEEEPTSPPTPAPRVVNTGLKKNPAPFHMHPDYLLGNSRHSRPFLFTDQRQLFLGAAGQRHDQMIGADPNLLQMFGWKDRVDWSDPSAKGLWNNMTNHALLGRLGNMESSGNLFDTVSFWDGPQGTALLKPCLEALQHQGLVGKDTEVHHPKFHSTSVSSVIGGQAVNNDPEVAKRAELARQLHLLPSDQKKAAMKYLGLRTTGRANPWVSAMRSAGIPAASSHYFATSECLHFKDWLGAIPSEGGR